MEDQRTSLAQSNKLIVIGALVEVLLSLAWGVFANSDASYIMPDGDVAQWLIVGLSAFILAFFVAAVAYRKEQNVLVAAAVLICLASFGALMSSQSVALFEALDIDWPGSF